VGLHFGALTEKFQPLAASMSRPQRAGEADTDPGGINVPNYGQVPNGLFPKDLNKWAPRVGLATGRLARKKPACAWAMEFFSMPRLGTPLWTFVRNPPFQTRIIADLPTPISHSHLRTGTARLHRQLELFRLRAGEGGKLDVPTAYVQQLNFSVQRELVRTGGDGRRRSARRAGTFHFPVCQYPYPGLGDLNPRRPFNP